MVLPEFARMAEKTAALARASCSTKEHIRAIDGSVPVKEASNLHAGPCQAEMAGIEVAQNALCFAAPPGLAISARIFHESPTATVDMGVPLGVLGSHTLRLMFKYASGPRPCGCPVAHPSARARNANF